MTPPNDRGLFCLAHSRVEDKQQETKKEEQEEQKLS